MKTLDLIGYQVKVLDQEEREAMASVINGYVGETLERASAIEVNYADGRKNGAHLISMAESLENLLPDFPLSRILGVTEAIVESIDEVSAAVPECFELPYINGKNLLLAADTMQPFLVEMREDVPNFAELRGIHEFVDSSYERIFAYLVSAISSFDRFRETRPEPNIEAYKTYMQLHLASSIRSRIFLLCRAASDLQDVLNRDVVNHTVTLLTKGIGLYENVLRYQLFPDHATIGAALAGYGNLLKAGGPPQCGKGLECYQAAKGILGPHPDVIEGIEFYEEHMGER